MVYSFEGVHADADPSFSSAPPKGHSRSRKSGRRSVCELRKTCAKLSSGVRFGVRFDLERSCGSECQNCGDLPAFKRKCRFFTFRPHYDVVLETKQSHPERKVGRKLRLAYKLRLMRVGIDTRRFLQRFPFRFHSHVTIVDVVCRALGNER